MLLARAGAARIERAVCSRITPQVGGEPATSGKISGTAY
jgi:hypothetical protein